MAMHCLQCNAQIIVIGHQAQMICMPVMKMRTLHCSTHGHAQVHKQIQ